VVSPRHRALTVLRGGREQTARLAFELVSHLPDSQRLWVTPLGQGDALGRGVSAVSPRQVQRRLGTSCTAVVVDLHGGFDGDTLGRVHGFIWGGGRLILRLPDRAEASGDRMWARLERLLEGVDTTEECLTAAPAVTGPFDEQNGVVDGILEDCCRARPHVTVLQADRGRGKSAALGRVVARLPADTPVLVTGPSASAVAEVQSFAGRPLTWTHPLDALQFLQTGPVHQVVIVDEAAQLAVPLLQALVRAAPRPAHLLFATTVHGYEGTGRGFSLRFVEWLQTEVRQVVHRKLTAPIRWSTGDPLERFIFDLLLLDAAPVPLPATLPEVHFERVDRDRLVREDDLLSGIFGLLVAAHYRTTPADLHRLLDAPDTVVHVGFAGKRPVAVGWLVAEGGLEDATVVNLLRGVRLRGQVLAETLCTHAGQPQAGRLQMWRSVRTAVHPGLRRQGLASRLVAWEHSHPIHQQADLIGTAFGATPDLVRFRRSVGYRLVRLGVSRSARTGVPSAVMVWPRSDAAKALVDRLREALARDLPAQLDQMDRERGVRLSRRLREVVLAGLPEPRPWAPSELDQRIRSYVRGANPLDVLGPAAGVWLQSLPDGVVQEEGGRDAMAMQVRVVDGLGWHEVVEVTGLGSVPAAQRAVRRAMGRLYDRCCASQQPELSQVPLATTPRPC